MLMLASRYPMLLRGVVNHYILPILEVVTEDNHLKTNTLSAVVPIVSSSFSSLNIPRICAVLFHLLCRSLT